MPLEDPLVPRSFNHNPESLDLQLASLQRAYASGAQSPRDLLGKILTACESHGARVWASLGRPEQLDEQLRASTRRQMRGVPQPLFGVPFAVQDNIHCAGWTTTLGIPSLRLKPSITAPAVTRLVQLGAVLIGKTQLEAFGIGLMGSFSSRGAADAPHADRNSAPDPAGDFGAASALAVALGLVSFVIGTDSDGAASVWAARHGLVALKPRRTQWCHREVVFNCPSIESLCITANNADDAIRVFDCARPVQLPCEREEHLDEEERTEWDTNASVSLANGAAVRSQQRSHLCLGVPAAASQVSPPGSAGSLNSPLLEQQLSELELCTKAVDCTVFQQASLLSQQDFWLAERYVSARPWLEAVSQELNPQLLEQLLKGQTYSATEVFEAQHRQWELIRESEKCWRQVDALLLTASTTTQLTSDVPSGSQTPTQRVELPVRFANLLDLCTLSMPVGPPGQEQSSYVTLVCAPGVERPLLELAARLQRACSPTVGARAIPLAKPPNQTPPLQGGLEHPRTATPAEPGVPKLEVALVGARDEPLQSQLLNLGGQFTRRTRTAARYELFALAGAPPQQPALIRRSQPAGSIELDVYSLPAQHFGRLIMLLSWPLCIGNIELEDGSWIHGFVCEPQALVGARDVTKYGSWSKALR